LAGSFGHVANSFRQLEHFSLITLGNLLLYVSLVFSAFFLIRQNKSGLWLTYAQFPFRLLLMVLSFGFLTTLTKFFDDTEMAYDIIMWALLGLEIMRLVVTIQIHRKHL
jgi:hypothetical protein